MPGFEQKLNSGNNFLKIKNNYFGKLKVLIGGPIKFSVALLALFSKIRQQLWAVWKVFVLFTRLAGVSSKI